MENKLVVSSHYNEDMKWVKKINVPYIIYSKTDSNYNFVEKNKGQEVPCFLKYIIDHYNQLSERILFVHGHLNSNHQSKPIIEIINNLNWNLADYFSINRRDWYQEISENCHIDKDGYTWIVDNWYLFDKYLPLPEKLLFYSAAQFVVKKELILRYPIEFYTYLYDWIQNTEIETYITSRIFEYTWHYIFTKNPIEQQFSSIYF